MYKNVKRQNGSKSKWLVWTVVASIVGSTSLLINVHHSYAAETMIGPSTAHQTTPSIFEDKIVWRDYNVDPIQGGYKDEEV